MYLPPDILQCIGQFLPERALRRYMHLNSVFFHLHLKVRYKKVLVKWGTEAELRRVTFIRNASLVHGYIHHLELWMIDDYVFTFETFAGELLAAIKKMPHLTAITLNIKPIRPVGIMVEPTTRFFDSLWQIAGPTLTHLTLSGFKPHIESYIPPPALLPSLQKLTLSGRKWVSSSNGVGVNMPLLLNRIAPQLRTLEICDSFALLASRLPAFPTLDELFLTLRFDGCTSPNLVTRFFTTQTTLHTLQFHLTVEYVTADHQLQSFLSELSSYSHNIHLRTLKFMHISYEVCASAIRAVIPPFFDTLRTLEMFGRSAAGLSGAYENRKLVELVSAISMFEVLGNLSLQVPRVNLDLLVLLARELSGIESLRLHTADFYLYLDLEPDEEKSLRAWNLIDLSIYHDFEALDYGSMRKIARIVPSIESFWGMGDMYPPDAGLKSELERKLTMLWDSCAVKYGPLQNRVRAWWGS